MLSNGSLTCTYDSANRLISAGGHTYTYNAENVRIRNLGDCCSGDTVYTYDSNSRLSKLLCKTTDGVTTKYVYGRGLIGEEVSNTFKTYHFDSRGSTIAITDASGNITDTFAYDTYGKRISHTGSSDIIFGYNGRDGVVTDKNGLIYMRARYYSPVMKRFINADIVAGEISNAVTLNRFAYANGNPVSFVDPFGLSVDYRGGYSISQSNPYKNNTTSSNVKYSKAIFVTDATFKSGFPVFGHTRLYFCDNDGNWIRTEFAGNLKDGASSAHIVFDDGDNAIPDMYDPTTGKLKPVWGQNYVVMEGNFDACVELAYDYSNGDFGGYNFLFNNCSDYTDAILDVADVDGVFSQIFTDSDSAISSPIIREIEFSICNRIDDTVRALNNSVILVGKLVGGESNFMGKTLIQAGEGMQETYNKAGDVAGKAKEKADDCIEKVLDYIIFWN